VVYCGVYFQRARGLKGGKIGGIIFMHVEGLWDKSVKPCAVSNKAEGGSDATQGEIV
jgi:hypothetical protein